MSRFDFWLAHCRVPERVVLAFFTYTALLSFFYPVGPWLRITSLVMPAAIFALICAESIWGGSRSSMVRTWALPAAILGGYWQIGWFARTTDPWWQEVFLRMDHVLLNEWGLRAVIERSGTFIPNYLELSYLSLYVIPPACLGVLFWRGAWFQVDRFLFVYALGTLSVYALLPILAVKSPRLAFPGEDLSGTLSVWRSLNVWILNRLDISTSVFPSGHVATALSCALGMRTALPGSRGPAIVFFALAASVWLATIYGRYHYAVDGLASFLICVALWKLVEVYERIA